MSRSELIVGLDVGTTKVCAVVGEMGESGSIDIVGVGRSESTGMRKGMIVNIEKTVTAIKEAIKAAELMAGCTINSVYVGIAGSHIKSVNSDGVISVKAGEVTQKDISRAIDSALERASIPADDQVIHVIPQEYVVDKQSGIPDPLGMIANNLKVYVHIVTGATTSRQNIIRSCNHCNLDVEDVVLESIASAKSVLTEEEKEIGVALVDIGGGTTDIAVFVNGAIKFTSVIALGGQLLTNDIAYGLSTPLADAERIKLNYGCVLKDLISHEEYIEVPSVGGRQASRMSRSTLVEICEPRMEELLAIVNGELERSKIKDSLSAGVVLTGGTSLIAGCQELAEEVFGLQTRIGYPLNIGGIKDLVERKPQYATAVGLLRYGVEHEAMNQRNADAEVEEEGFFSGVFKRMGRWFKDVS